MLIEAVMLSLSKPSSEPVEALILSLSKYEGQEHDSRFRETQYQAPCAGVLL